MWEICQTFRVCVINAALSILKLAHLLQIALVSSCGRCVPTHYPVTQILNLFGWKFWNCSVRVLRRSGESLLLREKTPIVRILAPKLSVYIKLGCACVCTPASKRARRAQINFSVFDISNHCLLPIRLF